MPSTQEFRRRIKSVNSTRQITRAMEMVSSVKMQKAQKAMRNARAYIQTSWNVLEYLAKNTSPDRHPLLNKREIKKTGLITITSDRGLCGSYTTNIVNKTKSFIAEENTSLVTHTVGDLDLVAIGNKGVPYLTQSSEATLLAQFGGFDNEIDFEDILPISKLLVGGYLDGTYDQVAIAYSHFESSIKQTPVIKKILPITSEHIDIPELWQKISPEYVDTEFTYEPNPDKILDTILIQFIRMQIYGAILEANASEHSARMVAMKNASDNAKDLISDLTLTYNTIRQDNITREIAEISSAAEAMS